MNKFQVQNISYMTPITLESQSNDEKYSPKF